MDGWMDELMEDVGRMLDGWMAGRERNALCVDVTPSC